MELEFISRQCNMVVRNIYHFNRVLSVYNSGYESIHTLVAQINRQVIKELRNCGKLFWQFQISGGSRNREFTLLKCVCQRG